MEKGFIISKGEIEEVDIIGSINHMLKVRIPCEPKDRVLYVDKGWVFRTRKFAVRKLEEYKWTRK